VSHDEITTKIELKPAKSADNIVHINFTDRRSPKAGRAETSPATLTSATKSPMSSQATGWTTHFDVKSPWVIRLVAVLAVLILSMLVL
jgi:hypothetical protein